MTIVPVRVVAAGVCGSDVQRFRAGFSLASLGHELAGRHSVDGRLVAIRPLRPCLTCQACSRGATEHCSMDASIGRNNDGRGGFSGSVEVDSEQLYPLPAGMSAALATLADPLACVLHALRTVDSGSRVLILGDGAMAALAAVRARQMNAQRVTVVVKKPDRIERLAKFADEVVLTTDVAANSYDVVVEAIGGTSSEPILIAVTAVAPLGQVVALGVYHAQATADLSVRQLLEKEATLRGSKAYRVSEVEDHFGDALDLLARHPGNFRPIITKVEPLPVEVPQSFAIERVHTLKVVYTLETTADRNPL